MAAGWKTGLCDCFSDCETLAWGYFFPCGLYGRITERFGKAPLITDNTCLINTGVFLACEAAAGLACVLVGMQRQMVREKYGIPGDAMGDFLTGCCCPCCALMQHYREVAGREALAPTMPADAAYQQQPAVVYVAAPAPPQAAPVAYDPTAQPPPQ